MKNVLIIFPDLHLPFSPTTLNLFYSLKKTFNVKLISLEPSQHYSSQKINDPHVIYIKIESIKISIFERIWIKLFKIILGKKHQKVKDHYLNEKLKNYKANSFIEVIKKFEGEIIAVDFFSLWCAQNAGKFAHLVSLEIPDHDIYRDNIDYNKIKSVIIQSEERFIHLFKDKEYPKFFVQNSPPYIEFDIEIENRAKKNLIFCGSALPEFGIFSCLDFLKDYPEYCLTLKGAIPKSIKEAIKKFYNDLLENGNLIFNEEYMDHEELTKYISSFRIGFVFYDFYRFEHLRTFNYFTAPSGKMFQYINSGVPIIGNKLSGLSIIEENNIGNLITCLSSNQIKAAVDDVELDYQNSAYNARALAKNFDFNANIIPFLTFLNNC